MVEVLPYVLVKKAVNGFSDVVVEQVTMKHTRLVSWCCIALAAAFLSAVPLGAQGKWWQSDRHKRELGLTPEQSRRLEEIFQAAVRR